MIYLIDGHNLIPKVPGLALANLDDEHALIQLLQDFCRQTGKAVEVYFDQAAVGQAGSQGFGKLKATFIHPSSSADAAIKQRLQRAGRSAKNYIVVSSDRQIQVAAREMHARVLGAAEFASQLNQAGNRTSPEPATDPDLSISEPEIAEWLALFTKPKHKD